MLTQCWNNKWLHCAKNYSSIITLFLIEESKSDLTQYACILVTIYLSVVIYITIVVIAFVS